MAKILIIIGICICIIGSSLCQKPQKYSSDSFNGIEINNGEIQNSKIGENNKNFKNSIELHDESLELTKGHKNKLSAESEESLSSNLIVQQIRQSKPLPSVSLTHVQHPPVHQPPVRLPPVNRPPVKTPPFKPPVKTPPVKPPFKIPPVKPPVKTPPVKPPFKIPPVKPPVKKPPVKPPVKTPPVKPPVKKPPVKPPVKTPPVKPPVKTPPVKPPVKKPPVKPPVKTPPVKPPVKKPPVKPPVKTPPVKPPVKKPPVKPPVKTPPVKPPVKTPPVKPPVKTPPIKLNNRPETLTLQELSNGIKLKYKTSNPTKNQYDAIMSNYKNVGGITTKRELAMFIAQASKESGGFRWKEEFCAKTKAGCPHVNNKGGVPGKQYYGRGYIQLTHAYNYKAASLAIFGDDRLLKHPELVSQNEDIAWKTALWFWKKHVHGNANVQNGHFNDATTLINGKKSKTRDERFQIYKQIYKSLNIEGEPKY